jgi:hypothetical protein
MRRILLGAAIMAILAPSALAYAAAGRKAAAPSAAYTGSHMMNVLTVPGGMKEDFFRGKIEQTGQTDSNKIFGALQQVLGGTAPQLNYVAPGSQLVPGQTHISANVNGGSAAGPAGMINVDPVALEGLVNNASPAHNASVNQFPHEMSHLHQLATVLASIPQSEGGAQSFADIVAAAAARKAGIPYTPRPQGYDGNYAEYVKQVLAQQGRDWVLGPQFGRPTVAWP